jgi:hypothetical protein
MKGDDMTIARANVRPDFGRTGVRVFLGHQMEDGGIRVHTITQMTTTPIGPEEAVPDHLTSHLSDDLARAFYSALAEYYGHSALDVRTLRADYDAERERVDTFIAHLTGGAK